MNQYKSMVAPILSAIFLLIGTVTGHDVASNIQSEITDYVCAAILFGTTVWGIYTNHKKDVQK